MQAEFDRYKQVRETASPEIPLNEKQPDPVGLKPCPDVKDVLGNDDECHGPDGKIRLLANLEYQMQYIGESVGSIGKKENENDQSRQPERAAPMIAGEQPGGQNDRHYQQND